MITCKTCKHEMGNLADYCNKCGSRLPLPEDTVDLDDKKEFQAQFCNPEGHYIQYTKKSLFCAVCGKSIIPRKRKN